MKAVGYKYFSLPPKLKLELMSRSYELCWHNTFQWTKFSEVPERISNLASPFFYLAKKEQSKLIRMIQGDRDIADIKSFS